MVALGAPNLPLSVVGVGDARRWDPLTGPSAQVSHDFAITPNPKTMSAKVGA